MGVGAITSEEFTGLVESYHQDLMRLAFAMCGDRTLAEDAVQVCWQNAWRARNDVRDTARIRGWLFTITANEVRRQLRRRRLGEMIRSLAKGTERDGGEMNPERLDLATALRTLSVRDRQMLGMRFVLGMTSDEVGPYIGLSPAGTRVRLLRVLKRLRSELEHE